MKLKLKVPDHTTLFRRGKTIRPKISVQQPNNKPLYIIVDSTGLGIHGEGPWSSGKKRRGWRKLHISIDNKGRIRSSCNIVGFGHNSRRDFDKLFYNMIGIIDDELALGCPDKQIIKYVDTTTQVKNEDTVENMIDWLNAITTDDPHKLHSKVSALPKKKGYNKLALKILLFAASQNFWGLVGPENCNLEEVVWGITYARENISALNSAFKPTIDDAFGDNEERKKHYRQILQIAKGSQKLSKLKGRKDDFIYIIKDGINIMRSEKEEDDSSEE